MAFVTDELSVTRRNDLEDLNLEILWLEVAPFKSKRSLLLAGVYRPPSTKGDDIALENNIEKTDLSHKEIILARDFNIDTTNPKTYKKHRLSKGLITMNFKQLVTETTRLVSDTCLDHILTNNPPTFAARQYSRSNERVRQQKVHVYIKYRNMKVFNEEQFKCTLKETPWDSVYVFEDIDDILIAWESLFNDALDLNCPWRIKRVKQVNKMPWLGSTVIEELKKRRAFEKCEKV